jgi:hypothetical protein
VPRHTESRIQQLCKKAVAAKTPQEAEQIVPELREALHEHIQLAKKSLGGQASTISTLDAAAAKQAPVRKVA